MSSLEEARGLCMEMQNAHITPVRRADMDLILTPRHSPEAVCDSGLDSIRAEASR